MLKGSCNRTELADMLAKECGITKKQAGLAVSVMINHMITALSEDRIVELKGIRKFEVNERSERKGINPITKEAIVVPASKVVKFRSSNTLKRIVNKK